MKIELDLNNRPSLLRQRAELARALALIDLALHGVNGGVGATTSGDASQQIEADLGGHDAMDDVPPQFSIRHVMASGNDRPTAKRLINEWYRAGRIQVHAAGRGRRPTTYSKT